MSQAYKQDEALAIRRRLDDPVRLASALGLDRGMQRISSGRVLVRCPAHSDSTASCSLTYRQEDGTLGVKCFGCDFAGDVFHLIAAVRQVDLRTAFPAVIEEARRLAGMAPGTVSAPTAPRPERPKLRVVGPTAAERRWATGVESLLWYTPLCDLDGTGGEVAASLAFRGLLDEARADGWGVLPRTRRGTDGDGEAFVDDTEGPLLDALVDAGTLGALAWLCGNHGWQHPAHRLLIPWRTTDGRLWTLQRRFVGPDGDTTASPAKGGPGKYLFPSSTALEPSGSWVYGWDRAEGGEAEELWLCEGAVDALALRALNRRGLLRQGGGERPMAALGLAGLQSWGKVRDDMLGLAKGRRVFVALDADEPAERVADVLGPEFYKGGAVKVQRVRPRQGKDWAEWLALEAARRGPWL